MDSFFPFAVTVLIIEALVKVFQMAKDGTFQWQHYAAAGIGWLILFSTKTNIFNIIGLEGDSYLYWSLSYVVGAAVAMRGSGFVYDFYKLAKNLRVSLNV